MKKFIWLMIACVIPQISMADESLYDLIKIKQDKIQQLEKCQGTTKGLKIAGLTTLGITAIGVGVNVGEAYAIKNIDKQIHDKCKTVDLGGVKSYVSKSLDGNYCSDKEGYYRYSKPEDKQSAEKICAGLANGEWNTTFESGVTVRGISMCSKQTGSDSDYEVSTGNPSSDVGRYCWCKILYRSDGCSLNPVWYYVDYEGDDVADCQACCDEKCAYPDNFGDFLLISQ